MKHPHPFTILMAAGLSAAISQTVIAETLQNANTTELPSTAEVTRQQELSDIELNRETVVMEIIDSLRAEAEERELGDAWEDELGAMLEAAEAADLLAAQEAEDYAGVVNAVAFTRIWPDPDVMPLSDSGELITPKVLGDELSDLVFTPVTPCRIVDTRRTPEGPISPGTSRGFKVHGNLQAQGGTSCNNPNFDPGGVAINVTTTGNRSNGLVTVYPNGQSRPSASTLNFQAFIDLANSTVVRSGIGVDDDIRVWAEGSATHVVIDLLGYFAPPQRTAPDGFTTAEGSGLINNNGEGTVFSPTCPSGSTVTGGGHRWEAFDNDLYIIASDPLGNRWRCLGRNESGSNWRLFCRARCIRIPGR